MAENLYAKSVGKNFCICGKFRMPLTKELGYRAKVIDSNFKIIFDYFGSTYDGAFRALRSFIRSNQSELYKQ